MRREPFNTPLWFMATRALPLIRSSVLAATTLGASLVLLLAPRVAEASPSYVFKERDGVIRFSSKPPPPGVQSEVFTAKTKFSFYRGLGFRLDRLFVDNFKEIISSGARRHGLRESLVRAVIHVESAFNPRAVSPRGARGLMQLMPSRAALLGVKDSFHPEQNVEGGTKHLATLLRRYDHDIRRALAAYNAGEGAVDRYGGIPPYRETQDYVRKVIELESRYRKAGVGAGRPL